jgi:uncharacterized protein YcbX
LDEYLLNFANKRNPGGAEATAPLSFVRFRPNIVIDGGGLFVEETWPAVTIGEVTLQLV